jgi:hypothetical protein
MAARNSDQGRFTVSQSQPLADKGPQPCSPDAPLSDGDGQPDEAQEWADYDPDC